MCPLISARVTSNSKPFDSGVKQDMIDTKSRNIILWLLYVVMLTVSKLIIG